MNGIMNGDDGLRKMVYEPCGKNCGVNGKRLNAKNLNCSGLNGNVIELNGSVYNGKRKSWRGCEDSKLQGWMNCAGVSKDPWRIIIEDQIRIMTIGQRDPQAEMEAQGVLPEVEDAMRAEDTNQDMMIEGVVVIGGGNTLLHPPQGVITPTIIVTTPGVHPQEVGVEVTEIIGIQDQDLGDRPEVAAQGDLQVANHFP